MVGGLGYIGYRAATTTMTKGFQRVSLPTVKELEVDIGEMKVVDTVKGSITAAGNGVPAQVAEIVKAEGKVSVVMDKSSQMVIRIFEFKSPFDIIDELNRPENTALRTYLTKYRGSETRIITRIVRAYDHSEATNQTVTAALDAELSATPAKANITVTSDHHSEKAVKDGTIVAYQWSRIKFEDGKVVNISLDSPMLD